jgi:hypothetical protein
MKANRRVDEEPFVAFGPEQARKAREAAGLPEPLAVPDVPPDAPFLRRLWAFLTKGSGDIRKLWMSDAKR